MFTNSNAFTNYTSLTLCKMCYYVIIYVYDNVDIHRILSETGSTDSK